MSIRHAWAGLGLLLLVGCSAPVRPEVDRLVCDSAKSPVDAQAAHLQGPLPTFNPMGQAALPNTGPVLKQAALDAPNNLLQLVSCQQDEVFAQAQPGDKKQPTTTLLDKLKVPDDIQGSEVPRIQWPNLKDIKEKKVSDALVEAAVKKYFPQPVAIGLEPTSLAIPGPKGQPLTLADLQQLARANSPLLRQAATDIEAAKGNMIQAGLYNNPTVGIEAASAGPSGGPSNGLFVSETITTMGKLKVAQAAAAMDYENAKLAYRRAETDLAANVRAYYFAVLVAEEGVRENRALVQLTDEVYKVLVQQLKGGEYGGDVPMQMGVFAAQARAALISARNQYVLSWRNLATTLGLPAMPPTQLEGSVRTLPLPKWRFDTALQHVLNRHTDALTAENGILKARLLLRLAQVTAVPDINVQLNLTNDETPPGPNRVTGGIQVGGVIPIFNYNQGAIRAAQAALMRANEEPHRVRDVLTASVADAYRRYLENDQLMELYRKEILPKQVQAFRLTVQRHFGGEPGAVAFTDLIAAEQNLVSIIGGYLVVVQAQWQAVADLGSLLQTDDLFQLAEGQQFAQLPDLEKFVELPCCHPCNPLPNPTLKGADLQWPATTIPPSVGPAQVGPPVMGNGRPTMLPDLVVPASMKIGG